MEEFSNIVGFASKNSYVSVAQHGNDENLIVSFATEPVLLEAKSREEGRPLYEDRVFIKILFPGDSKRVIHREARLKRGFLDNDPTPLDSERFPLAWARFQARQQDQELHVGTPLAQLPGMAASAVLELKHHEIHTVEQLAGIPDSALQNLGMGARTLRDKAKLWLDQAQGGAELSRVLSEMDALRNELAMLRQQQAAPQVADERPAKSAAKGA